MPPEIVAGVTSPAAADIWDRLLGLTAGPKPWMLQPRMAVLETAWRHVGEVVDEIVRKGTQGPRHKIRWLDRKPHNIGVNEIV